MIAHTGEVTTLEAADIKCSRSLSSVYLAISLQHDRVCRVCSWTDIHAVNHAHTAVTEEL